MKRIEVINPFNYAYEGFRVVTHHPGTQVVIDRVAEVGVNQKCAKVVPLDKQKADELREVLALTYPKLEIPDLTKAVMIEWLNTGIQPLFGEGGNSLEDQETFELLEIAKGKYPDAVIPDVVERDLLIAFINDGDVSRFVSSDKLEDKDMPELLEIAKAKYPDVDIPPEVEKDVLIRFIESGVASMLASGGGN